MNDDELRARIRELLQAGTLPHYLPTAAPLEAGMGITSPRISVGTQPAEHCVLCGEAGPVVSYTYPDGRVIRFHARCNILSHEERARS